jgi:hypothetical protein
MGIGNLMNARGLMELIIINIALERGQKASRRRHNPQKSRIWPIVGHFLGVRRMANPPPAPMCNGNMSPRFSVLVSITMLWRLLSR